MISLSPTFPALIHLKCLPLQICLSEVLLPTFLFPFLKKSDFLASSIKPGIEGLPRLAPELLTLLSIAAFSRLTHVSLVHLDFLASVLYPVGMSSH